MGRVPAVSWLCCICYSWCLCGNGESKPARVLWIILWVTTRAFPAHAQHTQKKCFLFMNHSSLFAYIMSLRWKMQLQLLSVCVRTMYWRLLLRLRLCSWSCGHFSAQGALRMDSRINIVSHDKWSNEWMLKQLPVINIHILCLYRVLSQQIYNSS